MFAISGSSDSEQLERDNAILTFFRTLTGEQNNGTADRDTEVNSHVFLTSDHTYADALKHNEESQNHLFLPVDGNIIMYNALNENHGQETMTEAGVGSVQPEDNSYQLNLSEEFAKGGESEQTAALNRHSRTASYIDVDKETADTTNRPEQNWVDRGDLSYDGLSGLMIIPYEDTPEECPLAADSVVECVADGCTQPRCPHLLNGLANTHFQSTQSEDDAEEDKRGEPKGGDLLSNEEKDICKSLYESMSGVLMPLDPSTEQAAFELQLYRALSGSWLSPYGPSDHWEDTDPNLTGMESIYEETATPADMSSDLEKSDRRPKTTHEEDREIVTDIEEGGGEEDILPDNNGAATGFNADLCEPVSQESTEASSGVMSSPAFPPSSPLPGTSTTTRTTFSPGSSPTDKPLQLPALFSGLRVFRKGVMGPEYDTVAQIKSLLQGSKKELDPEVENNPEDAKVQRRESILDHLSQLLNRRENGADKKEEGTYDRADESELFTRDYKPVIEEETETDEMESIGEDDINRITDQSEEPTGPQDSPKSPVSGAEAAFDAFKAFFTPRPLRRDPSERFDLRKRIRSDKEVLKGLIERSANNTPGKESPSDGKSEADTPGDGEERTPGRLQAIWPPPRDEKVGLKYTEAEHQAALLQLKRECKEEEEKLQEDHGRALSRLREEHEENLALARLHAQRALAEAPRRGDLRDACVSTEDEVPRKAFRTVCVQTDRETFLRAPDGGGGGGCPQQQMAPPKRLDLASISLSLIQDKKSDSLWDSLEPPSLINSGAFEDLFAKGTTQADRKPLAEAYEKKTKARKIVKLLDAKRSQAVGIFISSLHLDMKDIKHAVLKVDHSLVDLETVEALYENRAQPEEVQRIRSHYETADQEHVRLLDKPEQFLYELSQIPDFAGRARCIIFQSAFNDTIASVHHKVQMVTSACTALREGPGVRAVVAVVLALGNHMNGGSRVRGQADGFGLDILPKLKDVKSQDQRMSLVDYVVSYYLHYVDQDAGTDRSVFPLPEPQDLFLAGQVRMDDLARDLRRLGRDLTVCEKDVLTVSSTCAEEHRQPFQDKMEAFLLTARKSHEEASDLLITSQKRFEAVVQYFGVRPRAGESEVSTAHFFLLWFEFCADFKTRWKKESKNVSKERLIEAQQSVRRITEDKKVEIRQVNPNSLKDRLRQRDRKASQ
ncbi:unnamed protein product [Boreogadus saida]